MVWAGRMADPDEQFDVVVVGGGPVGENAAARVVSGGLSAALVEAELFGGECSYWACMPSKALLRSGHALAAANRVGGAREAVTGTLSAPAVLARRDKFTSNWDDTGQVDWAAGAGITPIRGRATFTGPKRLTVLGLDGERRTLAARHAVVVCTGSVPVRPPITGMAETRAWGSREATSAKSVPRKLLVLGGGVVGVEMAQAWARLGAEVELVVSQDRPLARFEPFVGGLVVDGLRADGVTVHLDATATEVSRTDGTVRLVLDDGKTLRGNELLVATGRRPATGDLGLELFGLTPGKPLAVDDTGRVIDVDGAWLYAAGDVTGRAPLTHQGKYAARAVGTVIAARVAGKPDAEEPGRWSGFTTTADHAAVPQVIFTDPEVASIGLTADAAERAGVRIRVVDIDLAVAGSALHADHYRGKVRMVVDERRRVIVGLTFVGPDVAELLHAATVAVVGEVPLDRLWHAVPAYPTISEIWLRLLEAYGL